MRWRWGVNESVVTEGVLKDGVEFGDSQEELGEKPAQEDCGQEDEEEFDDGVDGQVEYEALGPGDEDVVD
jgi:hypothetical protein